MSIWKLLSQILNFEVFIWEKIWFCKSIFRRLENVQFKNERSICAVCTLLWCSNESQLQWGLSRMGMSQWILLHQVWNSSSVREFSMVLLQPRRLLTKLPIYSMQKQHGLSKCSRHSMCWRLRSDLIQDTRQNYSFSFIYTIIYSVHKLISK